MTYVMSDLHGRYDFYISDELYVCGDVIDKGDDSVKLTKWLMARPNVHCIRGNHEEMFLNFYHVLMRETEDYDEVLEKLRDYVQGDGHLLDWDTVEWLETLPYYIETDDFICVHAGVPLCENGGISPLEKVRVEELLYNRKFKSPDVLPVESKCVFYGHTSSMSVFPDARIITYLRGGTEGKDFKDYIKVHLDTGTFTSGILGCFCIDTCTTHFVKKRKLLETNNKLSEGIFL